MTGTSLAFRIAYNSVYGILCLILTALLLVVPGDFVRQALGITRHVTNLIIIAIVYVLTIIIVLFVYALRLYVTRTVLASIPKDRIPVLERGDVRKEVRDMVAAGLVRSAAIAWGARPKVFMGDRMSLTGGSGLGDDGDVVTQTWTENAGKGGRKAGGRGDNAHRLLDRFRLHKTVSIADEMGISLPELHPVWGHVEHYGWSSPASVDLPNLQYETVLAELPNLIEAKAVSQAPAYLDADADTKPNTSIPVFDADAVMLLQRAPNMTLRAYIGHLGDLDVLPPSPNSTTSAFLDFYERVRFSGRAMSNDTFRRLMRLFAELLREMRPLDMGVLDDLRDAVGDGDGGGKRGFSFDGRIDDDGPGDSESTSPSGSMRSFDGGGGEGGSEGGSIRRQKRVSGHGSGSGLGLGLIARDSSFRTAPTTPKSRVGRVFGTTSRSSSLYSGGGFAQTRRIYSASLMSYSSSAKSVGAGSGNGNGSRASEDSVIRLATESELELDRGGLPYVLRLSDTL